MIDKSVPGLWIYPDGREKLLKDTAGRKLLQQRWDRAWLLSMGICCLCDQPGRGFAMSLEHLKSKGSGGGKRDDRQGNLGISHRSGNVAKGSMSLEQYRKLPLEVRRANCRY